MADDPLHQLHLAFKGSDDEKASQSECPRTAGNIVNIKVGHSGRDHLSSPVIDRMVNQSDVEV
jgi:hypothetical protein